MSTKKIKETEDDLFDLEEESSSEDEESSSEEVLAIEKIGSENIKNNIVIGGFVTALIAAGFLLIRKFKKSPVLKSGDSNYDPVNFKF